MRPHCYYFGCGASLKDLGAHAFIPSGPEIPLRMKTLLAPALVGLMATGLFASAPAAATASLASSAVSANSAIAGQMLYVTPGADMYTFAGGGEYIGTIGGAQYLVECKRTDTNGISHAWVYSAQVVSGGAWGYIPTRHVTSSGGVPNCR